MTFNALHMYSLIPLQCSPKTRLDSSENKTLFPQESEFLNHHHYKQGGTAKTYSSGIGSTGDGRTQYYSVAMYTLLPRDDAGSHVVGE